LRNAVLSLFVAFGFALRELEHALMGQSKQASGSARYLQLPLCNTRTARRSESRAPITAPVFVAAGSHQTNI